MTGKTGSASTGSFHLVTKKRLTGLALILGGLAVLSLLATFTYRLPFVQEHLAWRVSELRARIKYALSPPAEAVFTPNPTLVAMVQSTMSALTPTATTTPTPGPPATPTLTATPTDIPTPLPASVQLKGVRHEYQKWNNCGPSNLSMALSFWGWEGDQRPIAAFVKPDPQDKNVMPYELADFVESETGLRVIYRVGGNLDLLKSLVAAGFPVMIEKGFEGAGFDGWMGHYEVITGYDDGRSRFTAQDSYIMADLPVSYHDVEVYWRAFNYTFLVVYPPEREDELFTILGPLADEDTSYQIAAQKASDEIYATTDRDQFFAWFNRGSSLVLLRDYQGAAQAYDAAFKLYATLDPSTRPWRMLWYQTGPYFAYYYSGRYLDVLNLATQTLSNMSEPILEESYYWRALARQALGDSAGAVDDLRASLNYHPGFAPSVAQLQTMGINP
jgi:tetratricopeptide (TPR) repeat protein